MALVIASAVGVLLALATVVAATPAQAAVHTYVNTTASESTADLDVSSVDIDRNSMSLLTTAHVQNLTAASYTFSVFIKGTRETIFTPKNAIVVQVDVVNGVPSTYSATRTNGLNPTETLSTAGITFTRVGDAVTVDYPQTWPPIFSQMYVGVRVTVDNFSAFASDAQLHGFGPIDATARQTSVVLALSAPTQSGGSAAVTATASVAPASATGWISVKDGATIVASLRLVSGSGSAVIPSTIGAGVHALTAEYVPDSVAWTRATSASVPFTVTASPTKVTLKLTKPVQHWGKAPAYVTVKVTGPKTGKVYLYEGKHRMKSLKVEKGKVKTYKVSIRLKPGKHKLHALFVPQSPELWARSTSTTKTLTVKR